MVWKPWRRDDRGSRGRSMRYARKEILMLPMATQQVEIDCSMPLPYLNSSLSRYTSQGGSPQHRRRTTMTEQLDTNADASADAQTTMQSEETTDATVTLADRIEQAYTDVLPALIAQLYQQYEGEIAPLQAKQAGLEEEYDALEQAAQKLQAILPAQERLAQAEADRLMVSGQLQEAKAKFTELQQAQQAPAAMRERQQEIRARIRALNGRKEAITKQVFERWYGEC